MDTRTSIERLQEFTQLITAFGKVERVYYVPGTERKENDHEHSYMLSMTAWYLAESNHLSLNQEKILKYALAHDLVEAYAGDTYIYSKDTTLLDSKVEREAQAAERIKKEFPEFAELHTFITGYVRREDVESRFVYALDKILPLLLIEANGGRSWREHGVQLEMLIKDKTSKAGVSPEIEPYFNDLIALLKENEEAMFGPPTE